VPGTKDPTNTFGSVTPVIGSKATFWLLIRAG
jgi:hypothetical protein